MGIKLKPSAFESGDISEDQIEQVDNFLLAPNSISFPVKSRLSILNLFSLNLRVPKDEINYSLNSKNFMRI